MFHTVETRWFGPDAVPEGLMAWFDSRSGQPENQSLRRDFYLQPIPDSGLSVKLREGGLEVKQRQRSHGVVHFGKSAEGLVERWTKWRFPLDELLQPSESIFSNSQSWVAVDKERLLRHYLLGETGKVHAVSPLIAPTTGCHLELATIRASGSRWWTIALEADYEGENALVQLLAVTSWLFEDFATDELNGLNSFGYPRWLTTCVEQI